MAILSSFEAVHYRGIDGVSLPCLTRANLITGMNGTGKTALLEAMWLFLRRFESALLWDSNVQRSGSDVFNPVSELSNDGVELGGTEAGSHHSWRAAFERVSETFLPLTAPGRVDKSLPIPIGGKLRTWFDGSQIAGTFGSVRYTPAGAVGLQSPEPPTPRPNCVIEGTRWQLETPDEYMQRYSDMVREGHKRDLINAMNLVLPVITDIEILTDMARESYLSATTTDGYQRPLMDFGGGAIRLLRLYLSFFAARKGVVLVDEVENGIHYSIMATLWGHAQRWMHEWDVQFVATTHSAECIDAAMEAFADNPEDLSIHKLFKNEDTGEIRAVTFSGEALEGARELNWEVR